MSRLARMLEGIAGRGDAPCLYSGRRWRSYADLAARIAVWQRHIAAAGPAPGSVIAVQADYSLDSISFLLAAWASGLIVAFVPRDADPEAYMSASCAVARFTFPPSGPPVSVRRPAASGHALIERLRSAQDAGMVIFTSGSTGEAKAALHSVERFLHKFERPGRALRTLALLQFDHVAGLDTLLYTLCAGGGLVAPPERDPASICALIEDSGAQVLSASPSFLRLLLASGAMQGHDLASLAVLTYGSEPMDAATLHRLNEAFPGVRLSQKYGTTETGAPRTISRGNDSLWMQIRSDGVETQIREGILWIRSEGAFLGYLNAPTPFDEHGWYCTSDVVELDGQWMRVLGREGDLINVGGEKVSPVEVEQVILELDQVAAVAVSGRGHPLIGQVVAADVVLRPGFDAEQAEGLVRRHCLSRLPRHKVPVTVDVVAGPLESTRHKVLRRRG